MFSSLAKPTAQFAHIASFTRMRPLAHSGESDYYKVSLPNNMASLSDGWEFNPFARGLIGKLDSFMLVNRQKDGR